MKKKLLALLLALLLVVLSACSSGRNDVSRTYDEAMNALKQGKYAEAADKLAGISFYEDSVQLALYCRAHDLAANGQFTEAARELNKLKGYRDADRCVDYFLARRAEETASVPSERAYAASLFSQESIAGFRDAPVRAETIRTALYQDGLKAEEAADWTAAVDIFGVLGGYKESDIKSCYASGRVFEADGDQNALDYVSAVKCFDSVLSYADSEERKQNCLTAALDRAEQMIKEEDFDGAERIYIALGGFCDKSRLTQLKEVREKAWEAERQQKIAQADTLLEEGRYDEAIALYRECGEDEKAEAASVRKTEELYRIAVEASEKGEYERSIEIYTQLKGKKDCTLRLTNDLYLYGRLLLETGKPDSAAEVFDQLQGVGSADLYEKMARYAAAEALEKKGSYEAASAAFKLLGNYTDAGERALACRYLLAKEKKENGKYLEAAEIFVSLGDREDSAEQEKDCRYLLAQEYEGRREWAKAIKLYDDLKDYSDSGARRAECFRLLGRKQLEDGEPEAAYRSFSSADDADGKAEAAFAVGEILTSEMNLTEALTWYQRAAERPETEERTVMVAQSLLNMEEDELSEQYASVCGESEKARAVLYALALRSLERKDEEAAMRQMKKAGDNADANERYQQMLNARVEALIAEDKYDDAVLLCSNYGEQKRADEIRELKAQKEEAARKEAEEAERQKIQARMDEAAQLLDEGKFDEAVSIYQELGDQEMINEAVYRKAEATGQPSLYMDILEYKDSREKHYLAGKELLDSDPEKAFAILAEDMIYSDAQAVLYNLADQESKKENCQLSSAVFAKLAAMPLDPEELRADCRMRSFQDLYRYGLQLREKGEWETAAGVFDQLIGLGEARTHSDESYYQIAAALEESGKYTQAAVAFEALGDYSDAANRAKQNRYSAAMRLLEEGSLEEAEAAFRELGSFGNAVEMVKECRYRAADGLFASGKYAEARDVFSTLGGYSDASDRKQESAYLLAGEYQESGQYEKAIAEYETISEYKDASAKWTECHLAVAENEIDAAEALLRKGKTDQAIEVYKAAFDEYVLTEQNEKADQLALRIAECCQSGNDLNTAVAWFMKARRHSGTIPKLEKIVEYCETTEMKQGAEYVRQVILWVRAENAMDAGDYQAAVSFYEQIDNEKIPKDREEEAHFRYGEELMAAGKYSEAAEAFIKAGAYPGAKEKLKTAWISLGDELLEGREYDRAREAYTNAGDGDKVKEAWNREADEYLAAKKYDEARRAYTNAGNDDKVREAWILEAEEYLAAGQYEQARETYTNAGMPDKVIDVWNLEGEAYLEEHRYDKAREAFSNAGNDDRVKEVWILEAEVYLSACQYDQAREAYTNAGRPDKVTDVWNLEGEAYLAAGEYEKAKAAFTEAGNTARYEDTVFEQANALMSEGRFEEAYNLLMSIKDREGVNEILNTTAEFNQFRIKTGNIVTFGSYEQDNNKDNGTEPIEWIVIDCDENKALLLSRYGLDAKPYNKTYASITWEKCTLRSWLNGEFMQTAFSAEEQAGILMTAVDNGDSQGYSEWCADGGNDTQDQIFLLSFAEAKLYLNVAYYGSENAEARVAPTPYAIAMGAITAGGYQTADGEPAAWWWLRSPGHNWHGGACVNNDGSLNQNPVIIGYGIVRPALWVNLKSITN